MHEADTKTKVEYGVLYHHQTGNQDPDLDFQEFESANDKAAERYARNRYGRPGEHYTLYRKVAEIWKK